MLSYWKKDDFSMMMILVKVEPQILSYDSSEDQSSVLRHNSIEITPCNDTFSQDDEGEHTIHNVQVQIYPSSKAIGCQ